MSASVPVEKVPKIVYAGPGKRRLPGFNLEHMLDRENAVDRARRGLEPCPTGGWEASGGAVVRGLIVFGTVLAVFGLGSWLTATNSVLWVTFTYLAVVALVGFIAAAIRFGMASDERPVSSERWDR